MEVGREGGREAVGFLTAALPFVLCLCLCLPGEPRLCFRAQGASPRFPEDFSDVLK